MVLVVGWRGCGVGWAVVGVGVLGVVLSVEIWTRPELARNVGC